MPKCLKCNVNINTVNDKCPLCKSEIEKTTNPIYPKIKMILNNSLLKKIISLIAIIVCVTVCIINYLITPNIKWSLFIVLQIILTYYVFSNILNGRRKVFKFLFTLNILVCLLSIFWDYYTGFRGWSINYVLPSLFIVYGLFMLILRFVSYFAFRENNSYIYLNICLEFVPIILLKMDIITFDILACICAIVGVINLVILIIFDGSDFKNYLTKKFHI